MQIHVLAAVFAGGALGTLLRVGLNTLFIEASFPYATMTANVTGSFLLGAVTALALTKNIPLWLKAGAGAGFCGGFTTMATLALDTVVTSGLHGGAVLLYLGGSAVGGIAAAAAGFFLCYRRGGKSV
ncbi:CrcB family protein [Alkalicoccus urumqiensis]|uniref:Fluoride-specific ion channel FluC n=1 Tax=Alkalicoccus urumqiensis TaxID=1548213 RepID=A0A2P6MHI7_ALKUR|nr:CrcB family protein [Alkalicoccus urumqiensis]PRO65731.1 chromosome condensation protein CrcB [Alkalicoccus urumqiensis]